MFARHRPYGYLANIGDGGERASKQHEGLLMVYVVHDHCFDPESKNCKCEPCADLKAEHATTEEDTDSELPSDFEFWIEKQPCATNKNNVDSPDGNTRSPSPRAMTSSSLSVSSYSETPYPPFKRARFVEHMD